MIKPGFYQSQCAFDPKRVFTEATISFRRQFVYQKCEPELFAVFRFGLIIQFPGLDRHINRVFAGQM